MLRDIVSQSFSSQQDMDVVGETNDVSRLVSVARQARADVVIVMVSADHHVDWHPLLFSRPKMKGFAIDADGRRGVLHELRPFETEFGDISSLGLVEAARAATQSERSALSLRCTRGGTDVVK
jgi:hypothetical protein